MKHQIKPHEAEDNILICVKCGGHQFIVAYHNQNHSDANLQGFCCGNKNCRAVMHEQKAPLSPGAKLFTLNDVTANR